MRSRLKEKPRDSNHSYGKKSNPAPIFSGEYTNKKTRIKRQKTFLFVMLLCTYLIKKTSPQ